MPKEASIEFKNKSNSSKASETEVSKFLSDLKSLSSEKILENAEKQMSEPNDGDTIAIMHVEGYGDIKIKFFESVAPKACENFITHAKEGYYDGLKESEFGGYSQRYSKWYKDFKLEEKDGILK